jgi:hypothetical protein
MAGSAPTTWAPPMAALALRMDAEGASAAEIARATGTSRNSVAGFLHRATEAGRRKPKQSPDPIIDRLTDGEVMWALARRDAGVSATKIGQPKLLSVRRKLWPSPRSSGRHTSALRSTCGKWQRYCTPAPVVPGAFL